MLDGRGIKSRGGGGAKFSMPSRRLFRRFNSAVASDVKKQGYFWGHFFFFSEKKKVLYNVRYMVCIDMHRLMTGINFEKCIVRQFRHCVNVTERTYTNLR